MHRLLAVTVLGCASLAIAAPPEKPKVTALAPKDRALPPTPEQANAQLRGELTAIYEELAAAGEKGESKPFLDVRLPEYTETAGDGRTLDAAAAAKALSAWLDGLKRPAKIRFGVGKIDVQQDAVTALVGRHVVQREVLSGKSVEVEVLTQRHEIWLRRAEGWRMRHAGPESVVQRIVDGVVVPGE